MENEQNIGRMVIIDVESGDYEVDDMGITSAERLRANHPNARLYGIRIGYNVVEAVGGVMERTAARLWDGSQTIMRFCRPRSDSPKDLIWQSSLSWARDLSGF